MIHKNIPLAQQVLSNIIAGIESGELVRANGQLPSEDELGKLFDVSRSTVREALSKLEQRGKIVRQHGIGTFVAGQGLVLDAGLEQLESIETLARRIGLETRMGEAAIIERPAQAREAEKLGLPSGAQVLSVERQILASGRPVAFLVDIIPTTFMHAADLQPNFKGSVLDIFLNTPNPILSHASTDIKVEPAGESIMQKLGLAATDSVFNLESMLYSRDGQRMDYSFSYFAPGYFHFHVIRRVNPELILTPAR